MSGHDPFDLRGQKRKAEDDKQQKNLPTSPNRRPQPIDGKADLRLSSKSLPLFRSQHCPNPCVQNKTLSSALAEDEIFCWSIQIRYMTSDHPCALSHNQLICKRPLARSNVISVVLKYMSDSLPSVVPRTINFHSAFADKGITIETTRKAHKPIRVM